MDSVGRMDTHCLLCGEELTFENDESGICPNCSTMLVTHLAIKCDGCGSLSFLKKNPENLARLNAVRADEPFEWDDFRTSLLVIMAAHCPDCQTWEESNMLIH